MEITQEMKELKIDPINLVVDGDLDAMTRAIQNGCDRESIEAIIEHANTLVFNDQACTRNQDFELQQSQREDDEWIDEWTKKNPVPEGEMNHEEYDKASARSFQRTEQRSGNLPRVSKDVPTLGRYERSRENDESIA